MNRILLVVALVVGCRGEQRSKVKDDAAPSGAASVVSAIPKLPESPDGVAELHSLDVGIEKHSAEPIDGELINRLISRAAITQQIGDYVAALERSEQWLARYPTSPQPLTYRILALSRVHRFADARVVLARLTQLDPEEARDLTAMLDEATGHPELATPERERAAKILVRPEILTTLAANLALRGKLDAALALIPKAVAAAHDNSPITFSWLYFQWGRLYEQGGQMAMARDLFAEAHRRMPGYLEATVHLAQTMRATGQDPSALLAEALRTNPHPELLALAGKTAEAKSAWERYLAALPEAFSDHAARFYLGPGTDPARALVLAKANLANRDTTEARALAAEAALAAGDPAGACRLVDPLVDPARGALRAQQFIAWRALSACGRKTDADRVAASLGIH
jgi:tetratricopeptide (TPR) repeat protein